MSLHLKHSHDVIFCLILSFSWKAQFSPISFLLLSNNFNHCPFFKIVDSIYKLIGLLQVSYQTTFKSFSRNSHQFKKPYTTADTKLFCTGFTYWNNLYRCLCFLYDLNCIIETFHRNIASNIIFALSLSKSVKSFKTPSRLL